jgi:hypothetical protein
MWIGVLDLVSASSGFIPRHNFAHGSAKLDRSVRKNARFALDPLRQQRGRVDDLLIMPPVYDSAGSFMKWNAELGTRAGGFSQNGTCHDT